MIREYISILSFIRAAGTERVCSILFMILLSEQGEYYLGDGCVVDVGAFDWVGFVCVLFEKARAGAFGVEGDQGICVGGAVPLHFGGFSGAVIG